MSLRDDLKKIRQAIKPKKTLRFVTDESEIDDTPDVVWVLFKI